MNLATRRRRMVDRSIKARGVRDPRVLAAIGSVEREAFLPAALAEFAYDDRPLPIDEGQTISQPYIVALMAEALALQPTDRVLEIGTGSGYAAAVLAKVAAKVYTVERHATLAETARARLAQLGFTNIEIRCGDGTLGWAEHAPFDAIVVAAGGPELPRALLDQLAIGGRLVMPVGTSREQELVRITRVSASELAREELGAVVFVPLIGAQGWAESAEPEPRPLPRTVKPAPRAEPGSSRGTIAKLVAECAEPIVSFEDVSLAPLLDRIGDARVVLLGEATHGTAEFYRMRTRITQELVLRHGFGAVAVEADWPDAAVVDRYVRGRPPSERHWQPFARFPTWMWRNHETRELVEWLRIYNAGVRDPALRVSFSGLDLYSLYTSAFEVVRYLERVDPVAAAAARERYGRLTPWQDDPSAYGRAVLLGKMRSVEDAVVGMLRELLARRLDYARADGEDLFDATRNASVVANAEAYYRAMYYGSVESWNLRDSHMFDTLRALAEHRATKVVVWEHNSHVGDAAATELSARGEHNVGQLCRAAYGDGVFIVGFGTDHGTVAAAHEWEGPMERMRVRPARRDSYESLCHESAVRAFLLALRHPRRDDLRDELLAPRLERAIGVVYRPDTELQSHYFQVVLPRQFDEYVWFDETEAVEPLESAETVQLAEHHPFAAV